VAATTARDGNVVGLLLNDGTDWEELRGVLGPVQLRRSAGLSFLDQ
jgi:hypothetical protein